MRNGPGVLAAVRGSGRPLELLRRPAKSLHMMGAPRENCPSQGRTSSTAAGGSTGGDGFGPVNHACAPVHYAVRYGTVRYGAVPTRSQRRGCRSQSFRRGLRQWECTRQQGLVKWMVYVCRLMLAALQRRYGNQEPGCGSRVRPLLALFQPGSCSLAAAKRIRYAEGLVSLGWGRAGWSGRSPSSCGPRPVLCSLPPTFLFPTAAPRAPRKASTSHATRT